MAACLLVGTLVRMYVLIIAVENGIHHILYNFLSIPCIEKRNHDIRTPASLIVRVIHDVMIFHEGENGI